MVEEQLKQKNTPNLSENQKANRAKCLNILNDYWKKGTFPINRYHSERTPYFIDHKNTACAVGQLIRETGYHELAKKIQKENNYDYIFELVNKYPEIKVWSDQYGFEVEELAWIQPCYCSPTAGITHVSCHGGHDGSIGPDFEEINGTSPYDYGGAYIWYNNEWNRLMCDGCNVSVGEYKTIVIDSEGVIFEQFGTITQPDSLYAVISSTANTGNCNGSISIEMNGGVPPYTYFWTPPVEPSNTIVDLCEGMYTVTVFDANGCMFVDSSEVTLSTGLEFIEEIKFAVTPNPTFGQLNLSLNNSSMDRLEISIFSMNGKKVLTQTTRGEKIEFDLSALSNGIYLVSVSDGKNISTKKILKSN